MPLLTPLAASADPCGGNGSAGAFGWFGGGGQNTNPADGPDSTGSNAKSNIVEWLTGPKSKQASGLAIGGTDLGIMWDNGVKGPSHKVLVMFGDTFSCTGDGNHRSNVMFRTADANLSDGMAIPGSAFGYAQGGAPIDLDGGSARKMIDPLPTNAPEVTVIPTAGIAINDGVQVVNYMSVQAWGAPGYWTTNHSALAVSYDNGETFTSVPRTIRTNDGGNRNFQMGAFVKKDGYVYSFGTPQGRQGSAYVSRVSEPRVFELEQYEYWNGQSWVSGDASAATAVMRGPIAEMSVAWNDYLKKFISLTYADGSVQLRTSDKPEGPWSDPRSILDDGQLPGGFYGPFIHPWSSGPDLYYTLSLWSTYNVLLMHTRLDGQ
ncbi:MAG: DUF4185 domain-containing protein [Nocardiaceae bacterium]|nr:DUF4185 domain-containing protein [Nocardiaceae bacterium]